MKVSEAYKSLEYGPAPEGAGEAMAWIDSHKGQFSLFIGGKWTPPNSSRFFETQNPCNRKKLARVAAAGKEDINKAVASARKAFVIWSGLSGNTRGRYLYALARLLQKHARLFAVLESLDNGKTIRETRDIDIPLVVRHFYHHAGWAQVMTDEFPGYGPIGVVGQIIPWNFPMLMLAWKVAPALAAGNTVVLKPAEQTPLTALLFAELCQRAGIPEGVINIVTGDGKTGAFLVEHPGIDKIAFTGSTEVGRIIRRATAGTGKKLSLELGGKSPFIVFEDADIDGAVEGVVDAIWFNQGEVCCAGSRLLVQEGVAERFHRKLKRRMSKLRVGDSLDKSHDIGALVSDIQLKNVTNLVSDGIREGGELWQEVKCPTEGYYYPPTLITGITPSHTLAQVEIFGPVLVSMTFRTPAEAVEIANNTRYGLAASIWTENINVALDLAPRIKAGTVWINCTNVFDAASGFGGYRESGFGREGGSEGMFEYLKAPEVPRVKSVKAKVKAAKMTGYSPALDRTPKIYIGGKQVRPDGGYSLEVRDASGTILGEVGKGNRKDIRNAVEAAHKALGSWCSTTGHQRAQVLYYLAENLETRKDEFVQRIVSQSRHSRKEADAEFKAALERIFYYAAMADKYDGRVHHTVTRNVTLAMPEALGVMGIRCPDESSLLGFISTVIPAVAMGNTVVALPSGPMPLSATDLYQVMDTSDIPGGVINIVTGPAEELTQVLAQHDDVDAVWYFGTPEGSRMVEEVSAENMKRTWVHTYERNWLDIRIGQGSEFLRHASQVKNIWIPYGA